MTVVHDHSELASKTQDGFKAKSKSQLLIALVEWRKKKESTNAGVWQKNTCPIRPGIDLVCLLFS